jgi:hypothetical protein
VIKYCRKNPVAWGLWVRFRNRVFSEFLGGD